MPERLSILVVDATVSDLQSPDDLTKELILSQNSSTDSLEEVFSVSSHREQQIEAGGLRVRFAFQGDRFAHAIKVARGAQWVEFISSIEGTPLDLWPPSPPLQSLHLEARPPERQLALLVGMAGKSHWSVSVELDPAGWVSFDIACRVRSEESIHLGNEYQPLQPALETSDSCLVFANPIGQGRMALEILESCGPARLRFDDGHLRIEPADMAGQSPRTVRWGYRISRFP